LLALFAVFATAAVLALLTGSLAAADSTVTVNTTNAASTMGDGLCSLPEAVAYADGSAEPDCAPGTASGTTTININANTVKYSITSVLSITKPTVINGSGPAATIIDGGGTTQVFNIAAGVSVTINDVTISGGDAGDSSAGCTTGVPPFFFHSCPQENGNPGGGIANAGALVLENSVVTGNVTAAGVLPFSNFFIIFCSPNCPAKAGESAGGGGHGGGIYNGPSGASMSILNSTVSSNTSGAGGNATDGDSGSGTGAGAGTGEPGGTAGYGGFGGGIFNDFGSTLSIANSTISGNAAGTGGNAGAGSNSTLGGGKGGDAGGAGQGGLGGGIFNEGTLTITGSTLAGNKSGVGGNGASAGTGPGGSGFGEPAGNGGNGGALFNETSTNITTTLSDDTITGNVTSLGGTGGTGSGTPGAGGGIYQEGAGPVQLTFATVAQNKAAGTVGGLFEASFAGPTFEQNSIVASNTGTPAANCTPAGITDHGDNFVFGDNSCPGTAADPKLGPLASNGGPTQTIALLPGSPAINAVPIMSCPITVDQRGVSRPQGPACDSGAYEVAPPVISSPSAAGTSPTTGTVSAKINPNEKDTTVVVNYGLTTAYGSTTPAQDVGSGNSPASFSAALSGLSPGTPYHADIVATNGDGTSASGDITFTTTPPLAASLPTVANSGGTLTLTFACGGGAPGQTCDGPITLTSQVTTHGGSAVAVSASAAKKKKPKPKPKGVTKTVPVGGGSYSVASGSSTTVKVKLNSKGMKLLQQFYTLPATLTVAGTTAMSQKVTFKFAVVKSPISFTWAFSPRSTTAQQLIVSKIPAKGTVTVTCSGGGCPFPKRTFKPHGGKVDLAPSFKRGLKPHATVVIEITAPNEVAKVAIFKIQSGAQPTLNELCQPPGVHKPTRCANS
jgi:hypothetical protein